MKLRVHVCVCVCVMTHLNSYNKVFRKSLKQMKKEHYNPIKMSITTSKNSIKVRNGFYWDWGGGTGV